MNARRVHEIYRRTWPKFSAVSVDWENLLPAPEPDPDLIEQFVRRYINSPTVLVHVSRAVGGEFNLSEAARFVCPYMGKYEIHISARDFSAVVVIGSPGSAAGVIVSKEGRLENVC